MTAKIVLPTKPIDRFQLSVWHVGRDDIYREDLTYFAHAKSDEVLTGDFYKGVYPPFIDQWYIRSTMGNARANGWKWPENTYNSDETLIRTFTIERDAQLFLLQRLERRLDSLVEETRDMSAKISVLHDVLRHG